MLTGSKVAAASSAYSPTRPDRYGAAASARRTSGLPSTVIVITGPACRTWIVYQRPGGNRGRDPVAR